MPDRRLKQVMGEAVQGQPRIPYDRTDPMVGQSQAPPPDVQGGPGAFEGAAGGGPPTGQPQDITSLLGGLGDQGSGLDLGSLAGQDLGGSSTDQLTGADLGALGGNVGSPEDLAVSQLEAAINDPSTPPEVVQRILQQVTMAARRKLAGVGSPDVGGLGGGGLGA